MSDRIDRGDYPDRDDRKNPPVLPVDKTGIITASIKGEIPARFAAVLSLIRSHGAELSAEQIRLLNRIKVIDIQGVYGPYTYVAQATYMVPTWAIEQWDMVYLATTLIHEGKHIDLASSGVPYDGYDAEKACVREQLGLARIIGLDAYSIAYLESIMRGEILPWWGNA